MSLKNHLRTWRRSFKEKLPFVRRTVYKKMQAQLSRKEEEIKLKTRYIGLGINIKATAAAINEAKPLLQPLTGEVCFFVTYAPDPHIKPHVHFHIEQLRRAGLNVVLIINTSIAASEFFIEPACKAQLSAVLIRENLGFDFAAWAHAYALYGADQKWDRLFLVNDSILGPLSEETFDRMMQQVRCADADVVGLTENLFPQPHLQSFFLMLNATALHHQAMAYVFDSILNLSTKQHVIDVYEVCLTRFLKQRGLRCEPIFPALTTHVNNSNDTHWRWDKLIELGFPYVKISLINALGNSPSLDPWVPSSLRTMLEKNPENSR